MIIGARGDVVTKIFGRDIPTMNRISREVAEVVRGLDGATDVFALRNEGMKYLTIRVDRLAAGRLHCAASECASRRASATWASYAVARRWSASRTAPTIVRRVFR
jgi:Cu/Ag efflux pump CusA